MGRLHCQTIRSKRFEQRMPCVFRTVATAILICLASLRAAGLEDMLVIQHSLVARLRLLSLNLCTSPCRTGQIATIVFEAGLALVAHRARISLSSRLDLYRD